MSEGTPALAGMTKAQTSARFNKLNFMTECIQQEDDFYALYLGAARNVLAAHPIPASTGTTPAVLSDASEVCGTIAEMLPAPSAVFTEDYFSRPSYPITILLNVAQFHVFYNVEDAFLAQLSLFNYEKAHKGIMNQMWFAYVLCFDQDSTRSGIDNFKNTRSALAHTPPGAAVAPEAPVTTGTPRACVRSKPMPPRLAMQSASGPLPGLTGFDPATIGTGLVPGMSWGPFGSLMIAEGPPRRQAVSREHFRPTCITIPWSWCRPFTWIRAHAKYGLCAPKLCDNKV